MENDHKMVVRVPADWHRKVKAEAALRGISLSQLIRTTVDEWLERNKKVKGGKQDGKER